MSLKVISVLLLQPATACCIICLLQILSRTISCSSTPQLLLFCAAFHFLKVQQIMLLVLLRFCDGLVTVAWHCRSRQEQVFGYTHCQCRCDGKAPSGQATQASQPIGKCHQPGAGQQCELRSNSTAQHSTAQHSTQQCDLCSNSTGQQQWQGLPGVCT